MTTITTTKTSSINLQYEDLSGEEELNKLFYQEDDFKDDYGDGGIAYMQDQRRMTNHNLNMRGGFFFLIKIGEEITQVLMNIG